VGARIDRIHVSGSNYSNNGYGVAFDNACWECRVTNSTFRNCRHATSTASSATRKGICRDCWIIGCDAYDTTGDCFDTHAAVERIHFRDCRSYDSAVSGFNLECPAASIVGCEVHRSGAHGILMNNCSTRPTRYKCTANTVVSSAVDGIRYSSSNTPVGAGATIYYVSVVGCVVDSATGIAFRFSSTDTFRLQNITCNSNTSRNCQSATAAFYFNKGDGGGFAGNHVVDQPAANPGIRFNDWTRPTVAGAQVSYAANASNSGGIYFQSVTNGTITGPVVYNGGTGIRFDNTCTGCTISDGQYPSCTTAIVPGTGTGHRFPNNSPAAFSQNITVDAGFTLQSRVSPEVSVMTVALAASRTVTLSTTGAYEGDRFRVTRAASATGAGVLNIGAGPLKALAAGQFADVTYTNGAWALTAFGSL
jgi:hypothetical protein